MTSGAIISACGRYRYRLWRPGDPSKPRIVWIMLNPSKADAKKDDPTIKRVRSFSTAWGFGRIDVVNLFGYRATEPAELRTVQDPIGTMNDTHLIRAVEGADLILLAWGNPGSLMGRSKDVLNLLRDYPLWHLRKTQQNQPEHPLYLPGILVPLAF